MQIIDPLSAGWGLDMLVSLQELALSFYINAPWFCLPGINAAPQPVTKSGSGVLPSSWLPSLTISRRISWGFPRQVFQIDSPWKFPRWQCSSRNGFYMISKIIYNYMSCFSKLKQNLPKKKEEKNSSNNWCFFMSPPLVPYKFHLQCHPQTKWNIKVRPCSQSQWHLYPTSETPPRRILLSETTWVRWVIYATESPWRISRYWPPVNGQPVLFVLSQPKKNILKKKEESQPDEVHLLLEQHLLEFYAQ